MRNAYVYVDGFNLYYSLKQTNLKWLDIKSLANRLLPNLNILVIKYFTADVSGARDPDAPRRQKIYYKALKTIHGLEIIKGNFITKTIWRPLVSFPYANTDLVYRDGAITHLQQGYYTFKNPSTGQNNKIYTDDNPTNYKEKSSIEGRKYSVEYPMVIVHTNEEKGSDVNIAAHLVNDACDNKYETAVLISADTDLIEPVRIATQERYKEVVMVAPFGRQIEKFKSIATETRKIKQKQLVDCQFPDPIILADGSELNKPPIWNTVP